MLLKYSSLEQGDSWFKAHFSGNLQEYSLCNFHIKLKLMMSLNSTVSPSINPVR